MEVKFKGKVRPSGRAFIVTVPTAFIKGGTLEEGKHYELVDRPIHELNGLYGICTRDLAFA